MSSGRRDEDRFSSSGRTTLRITVLTCLIFALTVGALVALSTAVAAENAPPELHSGEKIDETTIELLFIDDRGINESTIKPGDFLLSSGEVDNIVVTGEDTNASVKINLKEPIEQDELVVEVLPDSNIQDTNGTLLAGSFPSVTIEDMDGVPPRLLQLEGTNATGDNSTIIEAHFHEEAAEIDLFIGGQTLERFGRDEFEKVDNYVYRLEYEPDTDGRYFVRVDSVTDSAGNSHNPTGKAEFYAFVEGPDAMATIDFAESSGNNFTFDASQTNGSVKTYTWDFGDGTNATGERVTHEFAGGNYTVTLSAVDQYGNVGTDRLGISLPGERPDPENETEQRQAAVSITGNGTDSATVTVTNATANKSVRASGPDSLIQDGRYTLDAITVITNESMDFEYSLSTMNPDVITDAAGEENTELVGGFFVDAGLESDQVEEVVFEFSIDEETLDSLGIAPEDVRLRRTETDVWSTVQTTHVETTDGTHQFESTSAGFSQFAIVGDVTVEQTGPDESEDTGPDPTPEFAVTAASLNASTISPGEAVDVQATVENSGNTGGDFLAGLDVNGTTVATQSVTVAGSSSETVTFTHTVDEEQTVDVSVNGTSAGTLTVTQGNEESAVAPLPGWLELTNITVEPTEIAPNETVTVTATAENTGEELDGSGLALRVNGTVEKTTFVGPINPGQSQPVEFTHRLNETGTATLAINDTEAGQVTVQEEGGLFSFLGFLGVLPLGLLRTVFLFVGLPVLFIYLLLKGFAYYMGY